MTKPPAQPISEVSAIQMGRGLTCGTASLGPTTVLEHGGRPVSFYLYSVEEQ